MTNIKMLITFMELEITAVSELNERAVNRVKALPLINTDVYKYV